MPPNRGFNTKELSVSDLIAGMYQINVISLDKNGKPAKRTYVTKVDKPVKAKPIRRTKEVLWMFRNWEHTGA